MKVIYIYNIEYYKLKMKRQITESELLKDQSVVWNGPKKRTVNEGTIISKNPKKISKQSEGVLKEDLGVWFGTKKKPKGSKQPKGPWVNICRKGKDGKHPPCGRPEASGKGYPKCRGVHVASKMSDSQKRSACQQKRKAEKKEPKVGKGNKPTMTSYKPKNEGLSNLIKRVLREEYSSDRLYPVEQIRKQLIDAPKEIKSTFYNLTPIKCKNENGNVKMCVRIPEVLYVYLTGRY